MSVHEFARPAGRKELITGGNPDEEIAIPGLKQFEESGFFEDEYLVNVGAALIEKRFEYLNDFEIRFLWKSEGGSSGGKSVLGKCTRPRGLLAKYSKADFIIWAAADHCRLLGITRYQLEALLFHELCHAGRSAKEEPILIPHDFDGFCAEVERYGAWRHDLERALKSFKQLKLF
jgi:hypothetical protein